MFRLIEAQAKRGHACAMAKKPGNHSRREFIVDIRVDSGRATLRSSQHRRNRGDEERNASRLLSSAEYQLRGDHTILLGRFHGRRHARLEFSKENLEVGSAVGNPVVLCIFYPCIWLSDRWPSHAERRLPFFRLLQRVSMSVLALIALGFQTYKSSFGFCCKLLWFPLVLFLVAELPGTFLSTTVSPFRQFA